MTNRKSETSAHLIDSVLFGDTFSSPALKAVFHDTNIVQKWLDVEAALAEAQAELGIIPPDSAARIRAKANAQLFDLNELREGIKSTGHPFVPLINALVSACEGGSGEFVHWGATSQDITDTAMVLLIRDALRLLEQRLERLKDRLVELATEYRDLVMAGRTHGQHALPITLGFKFAIYISEFDRHTERLNEARKRVLVGQFGGAVGSLASLNADGLAVQANLMARLGLGLPLISWHTSRDGLAELMGLLSMIAATTGKIANEIRVLQSTEVAELAEPHTFADIGSSTMPHKRNPMLAENVIASAKLTRPAMGLALDAMHQEHERDMTAWGVEWAVIPETFALTAGAIEQCTVILEGLRVNRAAIERNLQSLNGLMLSEAVMMRLAGAIGRQHAHELVSRACSAAYESDVSFLEILLTYPDVMEHISQDELPRLMDPRQYIGLCGVFVDRVVSDRARSFGDRSVDAKERINEP